MGDTVGKGDIPLESVGGIFVKNKKAFKPGLNGNFVTPFSSQSEEHFHLIFILAALRMDRNLLEFQFKERIICC